MSMSTVQLQQKMVQEFMEALKSGNVRSVMDFYEAHKGFDLNTGNALHFAAERRNVPMMKYLAEHGASMAQKDLDGKIPLDLAIESDAGKKRIDNFATTATAMLLEHGSPIGRDRLPTEYEGASAQQKAEWLIGHYIETRQKKVGGRR